MLKVTSILVICLIGASAAFPLAGNQKAWFEFGRFAHKFGKAYKDADEMLHRFEKFAANLAYIETHNANPAHTYSVAVNHFADMDFEEFASLHLGFVGGVQTAPLKHVATNASLPESVDWRAKGVVNPVKNQGTCGSCWAFSTIGSVESAVAISSGKLVSLSEQQLVDCSTSYGNNGCSGGLMDNAFKYLIESSKGVETEAAYPYKGADGSCAFKAASIAASIASYADITKADENGLADAVANKGPVSVAIHVSTGFQLYSSGIYNPLLGCAHTLNHGVVAVGYGSDNGKDYWIVRNSWGGAWGEQGYIRMAKGKNLCGIADLASYPVIDA